MNPIKSGNRDAHALLKLLPVPRGTRCGLRLALAPVLPLLIASYFCGKILEWIAAKRMQQYPRIAKTMNGKTHN